MTREIKVTVDQIPCQVLISDEYKVLLEAKAAGRAFIAVEQEGGPGVSGAPYVVWGWDNVSGELAELVARRHLGLPWIIGRGERLIVRELTAKDRDGIFQGEKLNREEEMFSSEEGIRAYIKNQYPLWEFGIWALVRREDGKLAGLGGVTAPRLPLEFEADLEAYRSRVKQSAPEWDVLELGYRIFAPYRKQGLGKEACGIILSYCKEVLRCRVCALIQEKNQASRRLAESLGMESLCIRNTLGFRETGNGSPERLLLYGESRL